MSIGLSRSNPKRGGKSSLWSIVLIVCCLPAVAAQGKYGGGDGTAQAPYLIYTAEQMNTIGLHREDWDKHFKLMADLDLSAYKGDSFNLIGFYSMNSWQDIAPFHGVFDGNGHVLSNFTYSITKEERVHTVKPWAVRAVGMFRCVDGEAAAIRDLGLIDPNIEPANTLTGPVSVVGALVGRLSKGSIIGCFVEGGRIVAHDTVGGLVGIASQATISRCHARCRIACAQTEPERPAEDPADPFGPVFLGGFGGIAARSMGSTISECWSAGAVQGHHTAGGLVGDMSSYRLSGQEEAPATIVFCRSVAAVNGTSFLGGLVGNAEGKCEILASGAAGAVSGQNYVGGLAGSLTFGAGIRASRAAGSVSGQDFVGGLVGDMSPMGSVSNCYAAGNVSGRKYVGGLTGRSSPASDTIKNSYAAGRITGLSQIGGLVGADVGRNLTDPGPYIVDSFWDTEATGQTRDGGNGTGLTTAKMQSIWTYVLGRWDFAGETWNGVEDIWKGCGGRPMYPRLAWEASIAGDFVDPIGVDSRDLKALAEDWLGTVNLPCQSGDLTLDTRVDFQDFAVLARWWRQGVRNIIYETTLDNAPDWRADGQWQFGSPTGRGGSEHGNPDPIAGHTGTNVYGVNLHGDYAIMVDGPHYLTAGPFDCSRYEDVRLQFARWLNTDQADFVDATVEASNDGKSWAIAWAYADAQTELMDEAWTVVTCDIGDKADYQQQVYIRWGYEVLGQEAWAFSGWNIDDVMLSGCEARETIPRTLADP